MCIVLDNLNSPPFIPIFLILVEVDKVDYEEDGFLFPDAVEHLFVNFGTNAWCSNEDLEEGSLYCWGGCC